MVIKEKEDGVQQKINPNKIPITKIKVVGMVELKNKKLQKKAAVGMLKEKAIILVVAGISEINKCY